MSETDQSRLDADLLAAAWANDVPRARALIREGADVNAQDGTQQSAYLVAASEGHADLLRLTLRHGAKLNDKDSFDGTALIRAAERGHAEVVGILLRAGIDTDHVNRLGYQAIHEAIWLGEDTEGYHDTVRLLIASGAQINRPSTRQGLTPAQMAAQKGHPGSAAALAAGARAVPRPDATLLAAAREDNADLAAAALRRGAEANVRDSGDLHRTPLIVAANHDAVAVARLLVAHGASIDALDDQHDTAWLVTGVTGSVAMGKALLRGNPDLTLRNRYGGLSPIPASERGHADYIDWVVTTRVDLNHVNDLGWTALLEAVVLGDGSAPYQRIVRTLVVSGADPTIADRQGRDARELAVQYGHRELVRVLDSL